MASDKLVVIVGTTASGKSAEALQMALDHNGEIICADSRTIYKGMDIGTAKPSKADQAKVKHHLLDIISPNQTFTVAEFQKQANQAIADIQSRGKLPIMVGGTGLYVDAVIYNYSFRPVNEKLRKSLNGLTIEELQQKVRELGLDLPENDKNPRHLIKVLETNGQSDQKQELRANTLVLGKDLLSDILKQRIEARVDSMLTDGLENEVQALSEQYGWAAEAMKGIGYREWHAYFAGLQSLEETRALIIKNTWQFARRQRTWFRRNKDIIWNSNS